MDNTEYLLCPQYQTRDMMAILKEMQSDSVAERQAIASCRNHWRPVPWRWRIWCSISLKSTPRLATCMLVSWRSKARWISSFPISWIRLLSTPNSEPIDSSKPATTHLVAPFTKAASETSGHDSAHERRGFGNRVDFTLKHSPVTGAKSPTESFAQFAIHDTSVNWSTLQP